MTYSFAQFDSLSKGCVYSSTETVSGVEHLIRDSRLTSASKPCILAGCLPSSSITVTSSESFEHDGVSESLPLVSIDSSSTGLGSSPRTSNSAPSFSFSSVCTRLMSWRAYEKRSVKSSQGLHLGSSIQSCTKKISLNRLREILLFRRVLTTLKFWRKSSQLNRAE